MTKYLALGCTLVLTACGETSSQDGKANESLGYDTTEMFTGGQGVEGPVSSNLHRDLKAENVKGVDEALYSRSAAEPLGLVKYETSRQSKTKIRDWLKAKGGSYTFDNSGSSGVTTCISQAVRVPAGSYVTYEVQAIFVRNEDNISMLYDYGLRWTCRQKDGDGGLWTIKPC